MQRQRSRAHCFHCSLIPLIAMALVADQCLTQTATATGGKRPRAKQEGFWREARMFTVLKLASSLPHQNKQTKLKHQKGMIFGAFCLTRSFYFRVFVCIFCNILTSTFF